MQLVEIKKFDVLANSFSISEGVNRSHETVIKLIDKYLPDLEEYGRV